MAKFRYHAGKLSGSIGKELTYSSWRGINYVKIYNAPSNPKTKDQVAVRTVFQHTAMVAKAIYEGVLKPYTFPHPKKITAYNRMIQINQAMFAEKEFDYSKLKIFEGSLHNPGLTNVAIENPGGQNESIFFQWSEFQADPNDIAIPIVFDTATSTALFSISKRSVSEINIPTGSLRPIDPASLHAYLVFAKPPTEGTGEQGQNSRTAYLKVLV
jgi:hypothetical protein